jgi:hypothetical protein
MTVYLTYRTLVHYMVGGVYGIAGAEDRIVDGEVVVNGAFKGAKVGEDVVMYSSEVHAVIGVGVVTMEAYRDTTKVWDDGVYPNRLGVKMLAYNAAGVPLADIRKATGVENLQFVYMSNNTCDTADTTKVTGYLLGRCGK